MPEEDDRVAGISLQRLVWDKNQHGLEVKPCYSVVDTANIECPVFLQEDPRENGAYYYNHFIQNAQGV